MTTELLIDGRLKQWGVSLHPHMTQPDLDFYDQICIFLLLVMHLTLIWSKLIIVAPINLVNNRRVISPNLLVLNFQMKKSDEKIICDFGWLFRDIMVFFSKGISLFVFADNLRALFISIKLNLVFFVNLECIKLINLTHQHINFKFTHTGVM